MLFVLFSLMTLWGKTILSQFLAGPQTSQKCSISKVKTEESRDFTATGRGCGGGSLIKASQVVLVVKNPHANAGDAGDPGLIPGSEGSPGGGQSNPLQSSCLENPMDRGAWWVTVHGVTESETIKVTWHAWVQES